LNSPLLAARGELRLFALKGGLPARNLSYFIASLDPPYKAAYGKQTGQMK
jgi:hypothetical protein